MADRPRAVGQVWIVRHDPIVIGQSITFPNRAFRRGWAPGPRRERVRRAPRPIPPAVYKPFRWADHPNLLDGGVEL